MQSASQVLSPVSIQRKLNQSRGFGRHRIGFPEPRKSVVTWTAAGVLSTLVAAHHDALEHLSDEERRVSGASLGGARPGLGLSEVEQ
jgi:hypothetical protein